MGTGSSRREEERETRREAILRAAEVVFKEKGFESSSMDAVAAASDFTKRTVYQYFGGKEELLFEIAARLLDRTPLAPDPSSTELCARERLSAFALRFYDSIRARPQESALMDRALALRSSLRLARSSGTPPGPGFLLLESRLAELYASFIGTLEAGRRDGSLREDLEPEGAAFAIFFLLKGFLGFVAYEEVEATDSGRLGGDELARYALKLVIEGMAARSS